MCRAKNAKIAKEKAFNLRFSSRPSRDSLLIEFYLLFFNKKDLNNGIDWLIPCAMNANETTSVPAVQSKRIRLAARFFKWLCLLAFGVMVLATVLAMMEPDSVTPKGSPNDFGKMTVNAPIMLRDFSPGCRWLYPVFWLTFATFICRGIWFFYKLFRNVEHGIFFGRDNVCCIRNIGWWLVVVPFLSIFFETSKVFWANNTPVNIDLSNLPNDLLKGFFVIFVAWIMDEGRKIQEEQELTV
jgi:hypothetical protein